MLLVPVFPGHQMIGLKRKINSLEKHLWRQPSDAGRKTRGSTLKRLFYHESECLPTVLPRDKHQKCLVIATDLKFQDCQKLGQMSPRCRVFGQ